MSNRKNSNKITIIVLIASIVIALGLMIYAVKLLNDKEKTGNDPVQVAENKGSENTEKSGNADTKDPADDKNGNGNAVTETGKNTGNESTGDKNDDPGQEDRTGTADANTAGNAGNGTDNTSEANAADGNKTGNNTADGEKTGTDNTGTDNTGNNGQAEAGNKADTVNASDLIKINAKVSAGTLNVRTGTGTGFARVKINDEAVELKRDDPLEIIGVGKLSFDLCRDIPGKQKRKTLHIQKIDQGIVVVIVIDAGIQMIEKQPVILQISSPFYDLFHFEILF